MRAAKVLRLGDRINPPRVSTIMNAVRYKQSVCTVEEFDDMLGVWLPVESINGSNGSIAMNQALMQYDAWWDSNGDDAA